MSGILDIARNINIPPRLLKRTGQIIQTKNLHKPGDVFCVWLACRSNLVTDCSGERNWFILGQVIGERPNPFGGMFHDFYDPHLLKKAWVVLMYIQAGCPVPTELVGRCSYKPGIMKSIKDEVDRRKDSQNSQYLPKYLGGF